MHRLVSGLTGSVVAPLLLLLAAGCAGSPIGDPCTPESIPPGGFDPREIYLETSSVQCRTRVCMVYRLDGNPECICPLAPGSLCTTCIEQTTVNNQVYCSCRCSIQGGQANTPLCNCGEGFDCVDNIVTTGGAGVQGGYCVPCRTPGDTRGLDSTLFEDCPVG